MEQRECITKPVRSKRTHLTFEEIGIIQMRIRDHRSPAQIAKEIGRAPNTVHKEIKRGKVLLYNGNEGKAFEGLHRR